MDIEWEDLQAAFLSTRTDREFYLDRETGEVVSLSDSEDEEEDRDEEDEAVEENEEETLREEMESDPDRFILVTPVSISDLVEWMLTFVHTVTVKDLANQLLQAQNGHHPDREFDRVLRQNPAERALWIGFLETQVQEIIDGWTEENDVESDTPPPWKQKVARRRPPTKPRDSA